MPAMLAELKIDLPENVPADRVVDWNVYAPPHVESGFQEAWLALQAPDMPEMVWTPKNGGHWIPTTAELVLAVFEDHERFSNRVYAVPKEGGEKQNMIPINIDPPEHHPWRILLNSNLTPREVRKVEGLVRQTAIELIEPIQHDGQCDFVEMVSSQFPLRIFTRIVDLAGERVPRFKWLVEQFTRPDGTQTMEETFTALKEEIATIVDVRMGKDGDDMFSKLINGEVHGRNLLREEAIQMCALVMIAGLDTVQNFLGFAMWHLATHPQDRAKLVAEKSAIPGAVEELLRRFPIVMSGREVRKDFKFGGVQLKKGDVLVASTVLHGLDQRMHDAPMEVDFERKRSVHMTFGAGPHMCPGANLARSELRIALEEWLERIPEFALAPGGKVTFSGGLTGSLESLPLVWPI